MTIITFGNHSDETIWKSGIYPDLTIIEKATTKKRQLKRKGRKLKTTMTMATENSLNFMKKSKEEKKKKKKENEAEKRKNNEKGK